MKSEKFLSSCEVKTFFQQSQQFFNRNIDKFYYFSYGAPKETGQADRDTLVIQNFGVHSFYKNNFIKIRA